MTTILLAVGSPWLRQACEGIIANLGYTSLVLQRPLTPLSISGLVAWDAVLLDRTALGEGALSALRLTADRPLIGVGLDGPGLAASLALPLQEAELTAVLESLLFGDKTPDLPLRLDPVRRLALANGLQVRLTQTEFRLLQLLDDAHPAHVPLAVVLEAVWGSTEGEATSELVRSHLRNLRRKLLEIGLPNVVHSRRGVGYALHL